MCILAKINYKMNIENNCSIEKIQLCELSMPEISQKEYYFEYIKNFKSLPLDLQSSLIDQMYSIYSKALKGFTRESFFQSEFNNPTSLCTKIILLKTTADNSIKVFTEYNIYEFFAIPNLVSPSNKYLVSSGLSCATQKFQRRGIFKKIKAIIGALLRKEYQNNNLLHFDVSVNPISYFSMCKSASYFVPKYNFIHPESIEKFMIKIMRSFGYPALKDKHPLVTKEINCLVDFDKKTFLKNYNLLPPEIKYYIDLTGLEDNLGLCLLTVININEGNTLSIPRIINKKIPMLDSAIYEWVVTNFKPKI
ncbi:hypothetical protein SteCoe_27795 [Stentor coeruleus]|uniref:Uncharacterized protein n=1 Tax=Stentor coeruleus TaxID=5963 RepID=A0A1R2B9Y1_9CILI|nr:hypothetical protein SteCoe_27795 [Stentor coeruleus]